MPESGEGSRNVEQFPSLERALQRFVDEISEALDMLTEMKREPDQIHEEFTAASALTNRIREADEYYNHLLPMRSGGADPAELKADLASAMQILQSLRQAKEKFRREVLDKQ